MTTNTDFYPPPQRPGSNAIGSFIIGVSPIGTINFVWQDTILSQYANSQTILGIVGAFCDAEGMAQEFDEFYDDVWNLLTAQGQGLDVWGRILGVGRALAVDAGSYFGFEEALLGSNGWNQQAFYSGPPSSTNFLLSDTAYRQLLLAKAAFNICDGSIPYMNKLLIALFAGTGNAFVKDDGAMAMEYVFNFTLDPIQSAIANQSGVLPTPTGVTSSVTINP